MRSSARGGMLLSAVLAIVLAAASGCAAEPQDVGASSAGGPAVQDAPALAALLEGGSESGPGDVFEVWICEVPTDTLDDTYYAADLRLDLEPAHLVDVLEGEVPGYFRELSFGTYMPGFVAGGTHRMSATEAPEDCLEAAVRASDPASTAVFAIATAEHRPDTNGGFARAGAPCASTSCPASKTGRGIYLGASDFHRDWGPVPALDLIEHEMGHLLGWPHSGSGGTDVNSTDAYDSALDVMSNSAAPREEDPARRHAQDTLAINKVASGWIDPDRVLVAEPAASVTSVRLVAADAPDGAVMLVLPVDEDRFLTVEWLTAAGLNSFLPHDGATVTLVDLSESTCAESEPCGSEEQNRAQRTVSGSPPFADLLTGDDDAWSGYGWTVSVDAETAGLVRARRTD